MGERKPFPKDQKLTLEFVIQELAKSGVIDTKSATTLLEKNRGKTEYALHLIAKAGVRDNRPPHLPLDIHSLMKWLSQYSGFPYFEIDPLLIDIKTVAQILPIAYIKRLQVIPVKIDKDHVYIATSEPFVLNWVPEVEAGTRRKIKIVISDPLSIRYFTEELNTAKKATSDVKSDVTSAGPDLSKISELEQLISGVNDGKSGESNSAVAKIVDWLLKFAFEERATDIHLEPKANCAQIRLRIDGKMRQIYSFQSEIIIPVINRIKILANMQVDEKRKPQDGRIRYRLENGREIEMRLSCIPLHYGEKLVGRLFDPKISGRSFSDLGFSDEDILKWKKLIHLPHGLVLVTGPTGSGKSTTLHTSLKLIARNDVNICTIEDPVEILNDDLNQMQVNTKTDVSFGNAIRAFLRQDPDIIMVGEIRDSDAAKMAIQAALTGHLVLSSLHTNDAISSITRLLDLEVPPHLIIATLRGMMAQRLVRRLCESCKVKVPTPADGWKLLVGEFALPPPPTVFVPGGCLECKHTGYRGRLCLYEMLILTPDLQEHVRKHLGARELYEATKNSYVPLRITGAKKISDGITSLEEVLLVTL